MRAYRRCHQPTECEAFRSALGPCLGPLRRPIVGDRLHLKTAAKQPADICAHIGVVISPQNARLFAPPWVRVSDLFAGQSLETACTSKRPLSSRLIYARISALSSAHRMRGFSLRLGSVSRTSSPANRW